MAQFTPPPAYAPRFLFGLRRLRKLDIRCHFCKLHLHRAIRQYRGKLPI